MDAIYGLAQTPQVAAALWNKGKQHKVWAIHAPMGAGKTTLLRALGQCLGIADAMSSPSFSIVNEYHSPQAGTIYHMDWYRLKGEEEAIDAGVADLLASGQHCWVEWPEQAPNLLDEGVWHLHLEILDEATRRLYAATPETEENP